VMLPLVAEAGGFTIINYTAHYSTAVMNHGACSSKKLPGGKGITSPRHTDGTPTENTIEDGLVNIACFGHEKDCFAQLYMENNCNGPIIAEAHFNKFTGLLAAPKMTEAGIALGYRVTGEVKTFKVILDGGL